MTDEELKQKIFSEFENAKNNKNGMTTKDIKDLPERDKKKILKKLVKEITLCYDCKSCTKLGFEKCTGFCEFGDRLCALVGIKDR